MKLATALSERADLQRRISELGTRQNNNAKIQEGDKPAENPDELKRAKAIIANCFNIVPRKSAEGGKKRFLRAYILCTEKQDKPLK